MSNDTREALAAAVARSIGRARTGRLPLVYLSHEDAQACLAALTEQPAEQHKCVELTPEENSAVAAPQGVQAEPLTDEQIETLLQASGGRWTGDFWKIEDADLHPFVRAALSVRSTSAGAAAARSMPSVPAWNCVQNTQVRTLRSKAAMSTSPAHPVVQRFLFEHQVTNAEGTQTFFVDAATLVDAERILHETGGEIYCNEVEVMALGEPEFVGTTTVDDYGDGDSPVAASPPPAVQGEQVRLPESMQPNVDAFIAALPDLLVHSEGKYVVIQRGQLRATTDDYESALRYGYETFGRDPFIVQRVEPPHIATGASQDSRPSSVAPCGRPLAQADEKDGLVDSVVPPVQPPGATMSPGAGSQWHPIYTAPKDEIVRLWGQSGEFHGRWGDYHRVNQPRITHWMRIVPPTSQVEQGESSSERGAAP